MTIQRYDWIDKWWGTSGLEPANSGAWVLYSDHVTELDKQRMLIAQLPHHEGIYKQGFEEGREQGHREANEALYHKGYGDGVRALQRALTAESDSNNFYRHVQETAVRVLTDGSETDE